MKRIVHSPQSLLLLALLIAVSLLAAQCGVAAPTQQSTPEANTTSDQQAALPATEEAAVAVATANAGQQVQESKSVQASAAMGITVETKETDVSAPRTQHGGTYRDVATSDAVSFHPYLTTDSASGGYQGLVYTGGLLRLDEKNLDYIPNMAEKYTISDDGLTFTFYLRKDMKWSDGQPLTAQDFKWTYDQVVDPKHEFPYLSQLDFIGSYEALDDYTLQIKIKEVYAPALGQMSGLITPLPKHIWEKLDWSDPEKNPEINHPTVVSGPYTLKEWRRDQNVLFEANQNYWYHGAPNISEYSIEIVPDSDVAYEKMKSGESDTGTISPEKLEEARKLSNITVYEWWPATARWEYVGLNLREGFPTHDINVRHALSYALDKNLMTEQIMLGQAKRLCSVYPETSWVYTSDVPCYDYDPEKAKEEFTKAGYTFQDGKMVDKGGNQLKLKLIYGPNTNKVRELAAVSVQDYLSQIGIDVDVQGLEWSSYLDALQSQKPDWDMYIGGWSSPIEPHIMFTLFSEDNIPNLNPVAYINKKVEGLFKEASGTYDTEFRKGKYQEIQKIIADESPYIFLWYQKSWDGENKRIKGIEPSLLGIGWNSEDWYIQE